MLYGRKTLRWERHAVAENFVAEAACRSLRSPRTSFLYKKVFRLQKLPYGGCLFLRKIT